VIFFGWWPRGDLFWFLEVANYFKLRDLGQALDFGVEWDGKNDVIIINTGIGYALG